MDSTYEIHMGRSNSVTGPYLDKDGLDMRNGAGSLLLKKEGRFIGKLHVPNSCHVDNFQLQSNSRVSIVCPSIHSFVMLV